MEAYLAQLSDGVGIADTTLAHRAHTFRQTLGETEAVVHVGDESTEVAVVDAVHVRLYIGVFKVLLAVHLQQSLQSEFVCHVQEVAAFVLFQAGSDEQYGRSTAVAGLEELVFVDDKVLI